MRKIIIQCRTSSHRLPAKALLPILGIPSILLCAKRAANRGDSIAVATTNDPSDNALASIVEDAGIEVIRGSLNDVLGRFALAAKDLDDLDVVVRLTADNVFPDGGFIDNLVLEMQRQDRWYLGTQSPLDGLPYGMSAEAIRVAELREASRLAKSSYDREHVTPWLKRLAKAKLEPAFFHATGTERMGHLRCTLDTFADYVSLMQVFDVVKSRDLDPINLSWISLCQILSELQTRQGCRVPIRVRGGIASSELTLGTVQLGMPYGATNKTGQPAVSDSLEILKTAQQVGVSSIDTARAYHDSERRIGLALASGSLGQAEIITKLTPLTQLRDSSSTSEINAYVDSSVFRSCRELGIYRLPVLLLHRWQDRKACQGLIWRRLLELQSDGVINKLGASVQCPAEALEAIADKDVHHVQLPYNVLDWRWKSSGVHNQCMSHQSKTIHARSIYLQGILLATPSAWPRLQGFDATKLLSKIDSAVEDLKRESRADFCLAYVRAQGWIHSIVIGMETLAQLHENVRLFQNPPLTTSECSYVEKVLSDAPLKLLDPAQWLQN